MQVLNPIKQNALIYKSMLNIFNQINNIATIYLFFS